jgi:hypothetical protein
MRGALNLLLRRHGPAATGLAATGAPAMRSLAILHLGRIHTHRWCRRTGAWVDTGRPRAGPSNSPFLSRTPRTLMEGRGAPTQSADRHRG